MKISINDKIFDCEVADTEELRAQGLQFRTSSPPILFIFDEPEDVNFHMHNCRFPVDMIFLDENKKILKVYEASPEEESIGCSNVKYVLEAQDSGVKIGDSVMFNEKIAKIANEILKESVEDTYEKIAKIAKRILAADAFKTLVEDFKKAGYKAKLKGDVLYVTVGFESLEVRKDGSKFRVYSAKTGALLARYPFSSAKDIIREFQN